MKKKILAVICVLSLVLLLFTGCKDKMTPVYVQRVSELMGYTNSGAFNISAGVIMAQEEVKVERELDREISGLCVEVGQMVNEGDVLFIYKTANVSLEIEKINLEIEQLKNSIADLKNQITQLETEKKTALESEKLGYTLQIQTLQTDMKEQEYNQTLKEKELQQLKNNTDTGEVFSPITGEVKKINADGGYDSYTGLPLPYIVLSSTGEFRIKGSVNELNRAEFFVGQNVLIRSRMDSTMVWKGTITSMDNQASSGENGYTYYSADEEMHGSSNFPFYVTPAESDGMLLGQHVFIEPDYGQITSGSGLWLDASYILIDENAAEDGPRYFVWAADKNDKIEMRAIELGQYNDQLNRYEILSGLSKADRIAYPSDEVKVGAPVTEVLLSVDVPEVDIQPEEDEEATADDLGVPDKWDDEIVDWIDEEDFEGVELPDEGFNDDDAGPATVGGGT
ncbi:MAG: hypothetical protein IKT58_04430 [Oscillospiraceae bacterium]|nr:hypothetical protein [Oscillospiraceae bacterium]